MVSFGKNTTTFLSSYSSSLGPSGGVHTLIPTIPSGQFYVVTVTWTGAIEESRLIINGVDYFIGNPNSAFPHAAFPLSGSLGPIYLGPGTDFKVDTVGGATASGSIYQFSSVF